ncbi:hypothetical protein [Stieleria bergensis]
MSDCLSANASQNMIGGELIRSEQSWYYRVDDRHCLFKRAVR